ncbi:hypothetical protein [Amycolatopsis sp. lyj-346]
MRQATADPGTFLTDPLAALDGHDLRIIAPDPVFGSLLSPPVVWPVPPS